MSIAELVARYDGRAPRYTSYPTAPHFSATVGAATYARWLGDLQGDAPISLYVHVPFCDRLCYYCGCNTSVVRLDSSRNAYADRLVRELRLVASRIGRRLNVGQIHWGGGTPTTLPGARFVEVMSVLREVFSVCDDAEIAVELDPTSLPADRLEALKSAGVTRVSLGVQDLDAEVQEAIGRRQTYEETEACATAMRNLGVSSLNLDLIYGLPRQTIDGVRKTARRALDLNPDRVAVFGYAHVPWMKKHQALINEAELPGALDRFCQQEAIRDVLLDADYVAIGLDHFAKPSDAMAVALRRGSVRRSFQGYTTDAAPVLIGVGASAIGALPQGYVQNAPAAAAYGRAIDEGGLATARGVALNSDVRLRRAVIESLMCDLDVDLEAVAASHGLSAAPLLGDARALAQFVNDGLAEWNSPRIRVTEKGRPFVRSIAALFDAYLRHDEAHPRHARAI